MIAAEQWYEYQTSYQKYGIDMKPAERRVRSAAPARPAVRGRDKGTAMLLLLLVGLVCVALIIITAYSASITYSINQMLAEEEQIQNEIANLTVELKTATNIETIEERALNELGMTYAEIHEIAYVGGEDIKDFSVALKARAYNE
ncbi:MAG: cell division protein FtsL [Bacillota bacterium]|nr:cell division protein FtsL [Bacillota bacterium]